jgi:AcrR family transcriptional regulator
MSREQAADYDSKKNAIMDAAAALFAEMGYPNAKLLDVAKACGASKSMLYHYFASKDDLLFALLTAHLQAMIDALRQIDPALPPERRLRLLIETYTQKSTQTRTRHIVAMNDVKHLPPPQQKSVIQLERRIIQIFEAALTDLNPGGEPRFIRPNAMLLMGMLNWIELWYKPSGPIKPGELCGHIQGLFLHGFLKNQTPGQ